MKPCDFRYHAPRTLDEAIDLLAGRENAKILAGGQSLMAMLNLRVAMIDDLVDINGVPGLDGITVGEADIVIGAMTRQRRIERDPALAEAAPIFAAALAHVGHLQTRNRGTIGGSLCHLDPSAELPALCLLCDAELILRGPQGERHIPMAEFPAYYMTPSIEPDDPEFGQWALGPVSEANIFAALAFGLTRTSRHPERVIDFLRFMTSRRGNQVFAEISTWLPVIKGVAVPEVSEPFRPVEDGYPFGVNLRALGGRANDIFVQHLHLLSGQQADVDNFVTTVNPILLRAGRDELGRYARTTHENIRQNDSALFGRWMQTTPETRAHSRFDRLGALQLTLEARRQEALHLLRTAPPAP